MQFPDYRGGFIVLLCMTIAGGRRCLEFTPDAAVQQRNSRMIE